MAEALDGPVGLRNRSQNVTNNSRDQAKVIKLLKAIPGSQGGMREAWPAPPLAGPDGSIPKFVSDAIFSFQSFWKSKGVFHNIDGVVDPGMHTLQQLNDLADNAPIDPPKPGPPKVREQDIIIRFTGGPGGNRRDVEREKGLQEEFNTAKYLENHLPLATICYTGFREQEKFVEAAVDEAVKARAATSGGITIVIGSSAGGVSALKAASRLSARGARIKYLGINDAAFLSSEHEVIFKPAFAINLAFVTGGQSLNTEVSENFFQTIGHNLQRDSKSPTGFFSFAEFHGPLTGFVNVDLANKPRVVAVRAAIQAATTAISPLPLPIAARDRFAAMVHRAAGGEAEGPIAARLNKLLSE